MQEGYGNRLHAFVLNEVPHGREHALFIERKKIRPSASSRSLISRRRCRGTSAPGISRNKSYRSCLAADFDHIAKPGRGEQANIGTGTLDYRIGDKCRAVDNAMQIRWREIDLTQDARDAVEDCLARVVGRRQQLSGVDEFALGVMQDEIGERATDVSARYVSMAPLKLTPNRSAGARHRA